MSYGFYRLGSNVNPEAAKAKMGGILSKMFGTVHVLDDAGKVTESFASVEAALDAKPLEPPAVKATEIGDPRSQGYSGDVCRYCQGSRVKWAGHCMVCDDCGETTGCS